MPIGQSLYSSLGNVGLGAWSGPGSDPGAPYTPAKLRVPALTTSNYRSVYPDWVGHEPTQADLDKIMSDMYKYRLCWWAGQCGSYGVDPTVPLEQGVPDYSQVNLDAQREIIARQTTQTVQGQTASGDVAQPYQGAIQDSATGANGNVAAGPSVSTVANGFADVLGGQVNIPGTDTGIPFWLIGIGVLGVGAFLMTRR